MHEGEVVPDEALVRRLVASQFPQWSDLPLAPVASAGTDNALYRLGEDLVVRLPRIDWAVGQAERELAWLPRLAPYLPLAVPVPLVLGRPAYGYPWTWAVYRWLSGESAISAPLDGERAATDLAAFILALRGIDATDGPPATGGARGRPLAVRDRSVREAIEAIGGINEPGFDAAAATEAWESSLRAPVWDGPPTWLHGDLHQGNLLVSDRRLSAVIDFSALAVGDPAADLLAAWFMWDGPTRAVFRSAVGADDASWARGRGCALSMGLGALPYYHQTNVVLAGMARRAVSAVLTDLGLPPLGRLA